MIAPGALLAVAGSAMTSREPACLVQQGAACAADRIRPLPRSNYSASQTSASLCFLISWKMVEE